MEYAKITGATLVVAKLDRLARNLHFISGLMESGVDFVACDNPQANRLTIHILAAVAEEEARLISERTKAALSRTDKPIGMASENYGKGAEALPPRERALRKKQGALAGSQKSAKVRAQAAQSFVEALRPIVVPLKEAGHTLTQIAEELNQRGIRTRRGGTWSTTQVRRIL